MSWPLKQVNRTEAGLRSMYTASNFLYVDLQNQLFPAQDAASLTAEELAQWAADNGKMQVKHILFKTVDDSGNPLSDEEIAAAKQKAEDTLAQLQASDDMENLFDQLMNELSEDGRYADGTLGAPDGYLFGDGEMVQEFEDAAKALKEHELSGIVETDYGYHILLRLPVDTEMAREAWAEEQSTNISNQMNEQMTTWMDEADIRPTTPLPPSTPRTTMSAWPPTGSSWTPPTAPLRARAKGAATAEPSASPAAEGENDGSATAEPSASPAAEG